MTLLSLSWVTRSIPTVHCLLNSCSRDTFAGGQENQCKTSSAFTTSYCLGSESMFLSLKGLCWNTPSKYLDHTLFRNKWWDLHMWSTHGTKEMLLIVNSADNSSPSFTSQEMLPLSTVSSQLVQHLDLWHSSHPQIYSSGSLQTQTKPVLHLATYE